MIDKLMLKGAQIHIHKVLAQTEVLGNEMADRLTKETPGYRGKSPRAVTQPPLLAKPYLLSHDSPLRELTKMK